MGRRQNGWWMIVLGADIILSARPRGSLQRSLLCLQSGRIEVLGLVALQCAGQFLAVNASATRVRSLAMKVVESATGPGDGCGSTEDMSVCATYSCHCICHRGGYQLKRSEMVGSRMVQALLMFPVCWCIVEFVEPDSAAVGRCFDVTILCASTLGDGQAAQWRCLFVQ